MFFAGRRHIFTHNAAPRRYAKSLVGPDKKEIAR